MRIHTRAIRARSRARCATSTAEAERCYHRAMARRIACSVVLVLACWAGQSFAQAPPYSCGPDCTTPGRYVLCNDSFDATSASAGGLELTDFLERACMTFIAPAATFNVTAFAALFGGGDMNLINVEIYTESGTDVPVGPPLSDCNGALIPFSPAPGFSGLFFSPSTTVTTDFRICLEQQLDDTSQTMGTRPVLYDADGFQGMNTAYIPAAGGWHAASVAG